MKNMNSIKAILGAFILVGAVTGCGDDSADGSGGGGIGGEAATTSTTTTGPTTSTTTATSVTTTTSTGGDGGGGGTGEGGSGGDPLVFSFADNAFDEYAQIDRHGAVEAGTVGIETEKGLGLNGEDITLRDTYNAATPEDDIAGDFIPEISANVGLLHSLLDADLISLGLDPATNTQTVTQAGPVLIPDTIKYDPSAPTGYPNGRNLEDQVVDISLAAVLLDLGTHPITAFSENPALGDSLNPPANDVEFDAEFPYLAAPH